MNPYERTADEMTRQSQGPKSFSKKAIAIGSAVGAASFAPVLAKAAPFLSQYIPENLAIKGLSKINPQFGKFIQQAMDKGYDFKEVKDFIGEQVNQSQQVKEDRNIIEQYSPELHQFILSKIQEGRTPEQAGALATLGEKGTKAFKSVIDKITQDHKTPWSSILQSVYGSGQEAQPSNQMPQQGASSQNLLQAVQQANQLLSQFGN